MSKTPTKNTTQPKELPVIRANKDHINALFGMFAAINELEKAQNTMENRIRSVPNGWRDIKLVCVKLDHLVNDLCQTYPLEKLVSIRRMLPHMKYKVQCGVAASNLNEDENLIASDDLDTIAIFAHEQCKLCIEQNCSKCKLGKTFDRIFMYDRDDGSWAHVDFDRLRDEQKKS